MRNFENTLEETARLNIKLQVQEALKSYHFSMMEITEENGNKLKKELNKTLFFTIKQNTDNLFTVQIETFDWEYKNKTVSITEKEFLRTVAEITDDVIMTIDNMGDIKRINNLPAIKERVISKTARLQKKYVGLHAQHSFKNIECFYQQEKQIINDVLTYKQFGLLLNNFYGLYSPKTNKQHTIRYTNFMDNTFITINENAVIHKIDKEKNVVEVKVSGNIIEPVYKSMFLKYLQEKLIAVNVEKDKPTLNKYEGHFFLDMHTGMILAAGIEIDFSFGDNYKKCISYKLNEITDANNN